MSDKKLNFHLTITLVWDGHALNRDEKIGGNIIAIKKLHKNGQTYSFISKTAIRHYLWSTLQRTQGWKPTPTAEKNKVVQFKVNEKDDEGNEINIKNYAEIDLFGYMKTEAEQKALTRKAVIGITKAVSIEPYLGDMAFYANHDLAKRSGANPNPYTKEEHASYYYCSFTIDTERLGKDENTSSPGIPVEEKTNRILAVLEALHNGSLAQTSGESNPLTPIFFLVLPVKVPVPVAHSLLHFEVDDKGILKVKGLEEVLNNGWVLQDKPVYLFHCSKTEVAIPPSLSEKIHHGKGFSDLKKLFEEKWQASQNSSNSSPS